MLRWNQSVTAIRGTAFAALVALGSTAAMAGTELLNGFYAITQAACFDTTGTLYHCTENQCLFQEYKGGVGLNQFTGPAKAAVATEATTDRNGVRLEPGDVSLHYQIVGGSHYVRVVHPDGRTAVTTYLAKTDAYGLATFAFIKDGVSQDPSAKAQKPSRCEAYATTLDDIVADGLPQSFPRIETDVVIGLPLEYEYVDADNPANTGPLKLPAWLTAPREDAVIIDIAAVPGRNPDYPDLMVLWTVDPGTPTPIQFLSYDPAYGAYVDDTAALLAPDSAPLVDNTHGIIVDKLVDGRDSILLANGGIDAKPWNGSLDTLLVRNDAGRWEDRSDLLPRRKGWAEGAVAGVVTPDGAIGVYLSKIHSTPDAGSQFFHFARDGITELSGSGMPKGYEYTHDYTGAGLIDVNQDDLADLILNNDEGGKLFLNPGDGNFSKAEASNLPGSPLPEVYSPVTKSKNPAPIHSVVAIRTERSAGNDLLAVSTPFYQGYALQYLKNDGQGKFTDETDAYIHGAETRFISDGKHNYSWLRRTIAFNDADTTDIVTVSATGDEIPSQVFLNRDGEFHKALDVMGYTIADATHMAGKPVLILTNMQNIMFMQYPARD